MQPDGKTQEALSVQIMYSNTKAPRKRELKREAERVSGFVEILLERTEAMIRSLLFNGAVTRYLLVAVFAGNRKLDLQTRETRSK